MSPTIRVKPHRISLVTQTANVLRDELRSGRWGRWMPGEHQLCEQLEVSRMALRAALVQLEREGWFRACQGRRREVVRQNGSKSALVSKRLILLLAEPEQTLPPGALLEIHRLKEQLHHLGYELEVRVDAAPSIRRNRRH